MICFISCVKGELSFSNNDELKGDTTLNCHTI